MNPHTLTMRINQLQSLASLRILTLSVLTLMAGVQAEEPIPSIDHQDLDHLLLQIKPQRGESPWRDIHWMTDVTEARRRAVADDNPLVIFTAADGSPLGRT